MFDAGLGPEERDDVAPTAVPALLGGNHQILLGFEEDVGGALDRTIDSKLLCVGPLQLTQQVDDATPDVCRNQLDIA